MELEALLRQAGDVATLTDEELQALKGGLVAEADRFSASKPTGVGGIRRGLEVVDALTALKGDEARRRMGGGAIAASATPRNVAAAMAQRRGRAQPPPGARRAGGRPVLRSTGSSRTPAGAELADRDALGRVMAEVLEDIAPSSLGRSPGRVERRVARATWADMYPADRRLSAHVDAFANTARVEAVCAPTAVVASGGVCLPVNVDYTVPTWAGTTRPVRDSLPAFQADRGGIRFVSPPDVGVPSLQGTPSGLAAATTVWTEATDATPGAQTKPVMVVACGTEQLVYVNAIPTRLQFGNMYGRFAPEQIAANTDVALAAAAREAELELLTLMYNASKQVKSSQYLGATRDLLAAADVLAAQYRYSHRIPQRVQLNAIFPEWARSLIRADLARELAHDNTGSRDVLGITDAQISEWFDRRGISVVWSMDGLRAGTYGTGGSALANQFFGVLGTNAPTAAWPNSSATGVQVAWLLFAEGSYQFLDGGRLTLGVVRDSTLDATNDYEQFVETFEGVAFRGIDAYQVQSVVKPTGGSAGTVATTAYVE